MPESTSYFGPLVLGLWACIIMAAQLGGEFQEISALISSPPWYIGSVFCYSGMQWVLCLIVGVFICC